MPGVMAFTGPRLGEFLRIDLVDVVAAAGGDHGASSQIETLVHRDIPLIPRQKVALAELPREARGRVVETTNRLKSRGKSYESRRRLQAGTAAPSARGPAAIVPMRSPNRRPRTANPAGGNVPPFGHVARDKLAWYKRPSESDILSPATP